MLNENRITELLVIYLQQNNYSKIESLKSTQKGIDIKATDSKGKKLFVEVKGETSARESSKRFGQYFSGKQIWNHVAVAVLKTMLDMNKPENQILILPLHFLLIIKNY